MKVEARRRLEAEEAQLAKEAAAFTRSRNAKLEDTESLLLTERIRLRAQEEQVRLMAERLAVEAEAKRIVQEKEVAIAAEMERLRNRTEVEKLRDTVAELSATVNSLRSTGYRSCPR